MVHARPTPRALNVGALAAGVGLLAGCAATPLGAIDGRVVSRYSGPPLKLEDGGHLPPGRGAADTAGAPGGTDSYRVRPGDTLYSLARRFETTVDALLAANNLQSPTELRAGVALTLPRSTPGAAPPSAAPAPPPTVARPAPPPPTGVRAVRSYPLTWPVQGAISSRFGRRDGRPHDGIDISAPANTPVRAAAAGEVLFAGERGSYGNLLLIRHDGGLITVYAHNARLLVRKGQKVSRGQMIARVGQSGNASGPHLHFEVRRGVAAENPLAFLPP